MQIVKLIPGIVNLSILPTDGIYIKIDSLIVKILIINNINMYLPIFPNSLIIMLLSLLKYDTNNNGKEINTNIMKSLRNIPPDVDELKIKRQDCGKKKQLNINKDRKKSNINSTFFCLIFLKQTIIPMLQAIGYKIILITDAGLIYNDNFDT